MFTRKIGNTGISSETTIPGISRETALPWSMVSSSSDCRHGDMDDGDDDDDTDDDDTDDDHDHKNDSYTAAGAAPGASC